MSENLLQTLQQLVQDVIAPDVRELKVRMGAVEKQIESLEKRMESRFAAVDQKIESLEKRMESRFTAVDQKIESLEKRMESRFAAMDQKHDFQFRAILAAISESKMHAELTTVQMVSALSERVAVLEARQH